MALQSALREAELPCSLKHARMNNRSSQMQGGSCDSSRRLKSLSRVPAEVTAYLSYSGLGGTGLCRWR